MIVWYTIGRTNENKGTKFYFKNKGGICVPKKHLAEGKIFLEDPGEMKFRESEKIELKKSTAELKQALVDLCAFANSGTGTVYFGISDNGEIIGQEVTDNTFKRVSTTILGSIFQY